jgi:hypothetical protein
LIGASLIGASLIGASLIGEGSPVDWPGFFLSN